MMKRAHARPVRTRSARAAAGDAGTRERLLEAAQQLFSQRGFADVTVRDICSAADANVALVNYYFGDKLGLYLEVVDVAIALISKFNTLVTSAPADATPEEKLTHFVRAFLDRISRTDEKHGWVHGLLQHEMNRPTDAAARIAQHAIAPRIHYLADVIAELLECPPNDERVMQCVGSVHGLCLVYARLVQVPKVFRESIARFPVGVVDDEKIAAHVSTFALAGIRAVGRPEKRSGRF